jgi:hypothetical protein
VSEVASAQTVDAGTAPGHRPRAPRKNLLLSATIEAGALRAPVRIRNLSESGAMLDGAVLPEVGAELTVRRSAIAIGAVVVWRATGRCGVRFTQVAASVEEWVAGARNPSFEGYQGQARVDAIQQAVRSGGALPGDTAPAAGATTLGELDARLVEEIFQTRELLDRLGE